MDWHPVISVQQQTPDNDFCHFSISNVRFAFCAFFENRKENSGLTPGQSDDPVTRTWKMTQMTIDPVTQWPSSMSATNGPPITRTVARFVQAPGQDPPACSNTRQCWLQLWVSCTVVPSALLWLYSEFGADLKSPDSTRLAGHFCRH